MPAVSFVPACEAWCEDRFPAPPFLPADLALRRLRPEPSAAALDSSPWFRRDERAAFRSAFLFAFLAALLAFFRSFAMATAALWDGSGTGARSPHAGHADTSASPVPHSRENSAFMHPARGQMTNLARAQQAQQAQQARGG